MKITFAAADLPQAGAIVVGVLKDRELSASARLLDERLGGAILRAMAASRFRGKHGQTLILLAPGNGGVERVLLLGLGAAGELDGMKCEALGAAVVAALGGSGAASAYLAVDAIDGSPLAPPDIAARIALGATLRAYRFAKYFTAEKDDDKPSLESLLLGCADAKRARKLFEPMAAVAEAVAATRDIVSEPANIIFPKTMAAEAKRLEKLGVDVEILGEKEMRKLGMHALLGVGQGSEHESQMVVMQWWGAGKPEKKGKADDQPDDSGGGDDAGDPAGPIALIGKGVTFDTGGISIKPSASMEEMKWDMAGAGAVLGTMRALASRQARANVVGVIGLVENMPSGTAQRPGDVVTSMSGQTIEVINTDAEGRLVLCDCITYARRHFRPRLLIDLATLTGAIIIALGHEKAGLFATDDALAAKLTAAGEAVGEPLWRMPLGDEYDKLIKSEIADMKNVGNRGAGSIAAAQFLKRFVGRTPWAHLDIAGVAWAKKDKDAVPKGASAFGVRLLDRFVADTCETP